MEVFAYLVLSRWRCLGTLLTFRGWDLAGRAGGRGIAQPCFRPDWLLLGLPRCDETSRASPELPLPRSHGATEPRSHLPPLSVLVRHFITVVRNTVRGLGMFGLLWRVTRVWGLRHLKLIFLGSKMKVPGNFHFPWGLFPCPFSCVLS